MKVYKEYYVEDVLQLLEQAHKNGHLMSGCVDSDLASVIYDYLDSYSDFGSEELSEDNIYDFIRFEMELQTTSDVKYNYDTGIKIDDDNESEIDDLIEDFLRDNTTYIGNYTDSTGDLVHIFLQF
jgi:hypothetical protein